MATARALYNIITTLSPDVISKIFTRVDNKW